MYIRIAVGPSDPAGWMWDLIRLADLPEHGGGGNEMYGLREGFKIHRDLHNHNNIPQKNTT